MSEKVREPRPPVSELVPILMDLSNGFSLEISRPDMETFCKWWILIGEERYAEVKALIVFRKTKSFKFKIKFLNLKIRIMFSKATTYPSQILY